MDRKRRQVNPLQGTSRSAAEQLVEQPPERQRRQPVRRVAGAALGRGEAGVEQAVTDEEGADQPEDQDGLGRVALAVAFGDIVARRPKNQPADGQNDDGDEDRGGGVVLGDAVEISEGAAKPRQGEPIHETEDHELGRTGGQDQKAEEHDDVEQAGQRIPGVAPLGEPELQDRPGPLRIPVEAVVRRGGEQRRDPAPHDVRKHPEANEGDEDEDELRRDAQENCGCG